MLWQLLSLWFIQEQMDTDLVVPMPLSSTCMLIPTLLSAAGNCPQHKTSHCYEGVCKPGSSPSVSMSNWRHWMRKKNTGYGSLCRLVGVFFLYIHDECTRAHMFGLCVCSGSFVCEQVTCLLSNIWGDLKGPRWRELQGGWECFWLCVRETTGRDRAEHSVLNTVFPQMNWSGHRHRWVQTPRYFNISEVTQSVLKTIILLYSILSHVSATVEEIYSSNTIFITNIYSTLHKVFPLPPFCVSSLVC